MKIRCTNGDSLRSPLSLSLPSQVVLGSLKGDKKPPPPPLPMPSPATPRTAIKQFIAKKSNIASLLNQNEIEQLLSASVVELEAVMEVRIGDELRNGKYSQRFVVSLLVLLTSLAADVHQDG